MNNRHSDDEITVESTIKSDQGLPDNLVADLEPVEVVVPVTAEVEVVPQASAQFADFHIIGEDGSSSEKDALITQNGPNNRYKHDAYDVIAGGVLGLGVGAKFVNTVILYYGPRNPLWVILPGALATLPVAQAFLENKNQAWQQQHKTGMTCLSVSVTGVKILGVFCFDMGMLMSYWQSDLRAIGSKIAIPITAAAMVAPFAYIGNHKAINKAIRKSTCLPQRVKNVLTHNYTEKSIEVLYHGLNANSGMAAVLGFAEAFNVVASAVPVKHVVCHGENVTIALSNTTTTYISSLQVNVVSGGVAIGNMASQIVGNWDHPLTNFNTYAVGAMRPMVLAGAMSTSMISLGYQVTAAYLCGIVPTAAEYGIAIPVAVVVGSATAYRVTKYLIDPHKFDLTNAESDKPQEERVVRPHPARALLGFFSCGRPKRDKPEPAAMHDEENVHSNVPTDTDKFLGTHDDVEPVFESAYKKNSSCTIL